MRTVGFSDLKNSEPSNDTTSDFGAGGLWNDSDWTVILVDKTDILFLNESSTDVNNTK